jgi:hypothetical protein
MVRSNEFEVFISLLYLRVVSLFMNFRHLKPMNTEKTITYDIKNPGFGLENCECIFSRKGSHVQNIYFHIIIIGAHQ